MTELTKIIQIIGSQSKLANYLYISDAAVGKWVKKGFVPADRILDVFNLVKGKRTKAGDQVSLIQMLKEAREAKKQEEPAQ